MVVMGTPFEGDRQRRRSHEPPLSEFPGWGLDIMMGLYGPETIRAVCDRERPRGRPSSRAAAIDLELVPIEAPTRSARTCVERTCADDLPAHIAPLTPLTAQLAAADELVRFLERKFRRH